MLTTQPTQLSNHTKKLASTRKHKQILTVILTSASSGWMIVGLGAFSTRISHGAYHLTARCSDIVDVSM